MSEFSRMIDLRGIGNGPLQIEASEAECAALAGRFALVAVKRLSASVIIVPDGEKVAVEGRLTAEIVQSCAVSGEDLSVAIDEPVQLRFVPAAAAAGPDEEIELDAEDLDEITYSGSAFDLGEALAQGLALAIDPFAIGPEAERVRKSAGLVGEEALGPFAALAALKLKPD
jgi:uncharacterized metal-binding protein YceD (DUF177 family)